MIFRAIAYVLTKEKVDINNLEEVKRTLNNANIDIEYINGEQVVYVEGIDTRPYISLPEISQKASIYSQIVEIRKIVSTIQHKFADKYDLVIEGRDIGTEVFPNINFTLQQVLNHEQKEDLKHIFKMAKLLLMKK